MKVGKEAVNGGGWVIGGVWVVVTVHCVVLVFLICSAIKAMSSWKLLGYFGCTRGGSIGNVV